MWALRTANVESATLTASLSLIALPVRTNVRELSLSQRRHTLEAQSNIPGTVVAYDVRRALM